MADIKKLKDEHGIINKTKKILPLEYYASALAALAELEDNECHRTHTFPHTKLHKLTGVSLPIGDVYECYIDKISGWRYQVVYTKDQFISLLNISTPEEHDRVDKVVKSKKNKF